MLNNLNEIQQHLVAGFQNFSVEEMAEEVAKAAKQVASEKFDVGYEDEAEALYILADCVKDFINFLTVS